MGNSNIESVLSDMKEYAKNNWVPIVLDDTANLLEQLVQAINPKRILEIGTAIGYSGIIMARNLNGTAYIDTIEIDSERVKMAWDNIHKVGLQGKIHIIEGDAAQILPILNKEYDMIFSDAAKSQYIKILPECIRLLKSGGVLITDNMYYKGRVLQESDVGHKQRSAVNHIKEYIKEIAINEELKSSLIDIGDGIMISQKISK